MLKSQGNEQKQVFLDPNSPLPKTYFELIQKVGSAGKYQRNLFIIFILVFFVNGSVMLSTSFLFMNDRYACQQLGLLTTNCRKTVCEIEVESERNKYFVQNLEGVESAATDYGPFMCEDEFTLDLIKSCPYFGSFLAYIVFSYITDNFGRRTTMMMSLSLATIGSLLIVLGYNLGIIAVGVILAGGGINVSAGIVFYFLGQVVEDMRRQKYSILVQVAFTVSAMVLTGLYNLIGNWRIISVILTAIPAVVLLFVFVLYVQQTPLFLLKGENGQALKALNRIGYINFGLKDILTEEDLQNVRAEQLANQSFSKAKVSPLDLFKFSSLRKTTIIGCLLCYIIISMYYGPTLIIDSIGFNTYVSSFAIQLSQIIGFIPTYYYIDKVKRRSTGFILFLVTVVTSFAIALIQKPEDCDLCYQSIIQLVLIFIFRLSIAVQFALFLVYTVELFPTRVVGLGNGALSAFGTTASTLSPMILGYLRRIQFNLMLFFFILGVMGCALSLILQQTFGKPLKTQIEEITYAKNKKKSQLISDIKSCNILASNKKQ